MDMETNFRLHLPSVEVFFSSVTPVSGQVRFHMLKRTLTFYIIVTRKQLKMSNFCHFLQCHVPVFIYGTIVALFTDRTDALVHSFASYISQASTQNGIHKVAKTCSDLAVRLLKSVHRGCVLVELIPNLDMKFFGRRKLADAWRSCLLTSCCSRQCDNLSTPSIWCSCGSAALRD